MFIQIYNMPLFVEVLDVVKQLTMVCLLLQVTDYMCVGKKLLHLHWTSRVQSMKTIELFCMSSCTCII